MMAGNPGWWSMYPSPYVVASSYLPLNSLPDDQDPPHQSWSQLLLGGLSGDGDEDQMLNNHPSLRVDPFDRDHVKREISQNSNFYNDEDEELQAIRSAAAWSQQVIPVVSSPTSCVTSLSRSNNLMDFSYDKKNRHPADQSSECNSTSTGGVCKKGRVQVSSSQPLPPFKVRKEKLGDRITALHQLVSPFGKTDTASVLLEALGYIRFLQGQIEALSSPYLGTASSSNIRKNQHFDGGEDERGDLRSRGLCLVPVSCIQHVGSENGANYWALAVDGGF